MSAYEVLEEEARLRRRRQVVSWAKGVAFAGFVLFLMVVLGLGRSTRELSGTVEAARGVDTQAGYVSKANVALESGRVVTASVGAIGEYPTGTRVRVLETSRFFGLGPSYKVIAPQTK